VAVTGQQDVKRGGLEKCVEPLAERYDLAMLDLDGVVYVGRDPVAHAAETVRAAAERGMRHAYITNNASRPPGAVAAHLQELGMPAEDDDVVTSAQAAAHLLADMLDPGAHVFVIGGEGLLDALDDRGLVGIQDPAAEPRAVVSGYHPDVRWRTVIEGAILVREGLPWVATNTDMTVPTPRGPGPGNGVLVEAVARYAEVEPTVAGKPEPPLIRETVERLGGDHPLMVGDRLDTDIEGARRAGCDSLLVMTGVTRLAEVAAAEPQRRPTYVGADLRALLRPHPAPADRDGGYELGGWTARLDRGRLTVQGDGGPDDWWRVVAAASWQHLDSTGDPVDISGVHPPR
jgi:glycerol-1-phosphatase